MSRTSCLRKKLVVLLNSLEDFDGALEELQDAKNQFNDEPRLDEATYNITKPLQRSSEDSDMRWFKEELLRVLFKNEFILSVLVDLLRLEGYDGHIPRREIKRQ